MLPKTLNLVLVVMVAMTVIAVTAVHYHKTNIHAKIYCGKEIKVTADKDIIVVANCKNGKKTFNSTHESIDVVIPVCYQEPCDMCTLYQFPERYIFGVQISISHLNLRGSGLIIKEYVMTCSFEKYGNIVSKEIALELENLKYEEVLVNQANKTTVQMSLYLEDVLGNKINGVVAIGKKVKLVGKVINKTNARGIMIRNCYASDSYSNMSILVSGCGNGNIFPIFSSFVTNGLKVRSPFFPMFQLVTGGTRIYFVCTFIVCEERCDDGSCLPGNQNLGGVVPSSYLTDRQTAIFEGCAHS